MKKTLAALCAIMLCSTSAMAFDVMIDGIAYNRIPDSSAVVVTFTSLDADNYSGLAAVVIPAVVQVEGTDMSVVAIDDFAFYGSESITSVSIPSTVTRIGDRALAGCHNLQAITIAADNATFFTPEGSNAIIDARTSTLVAGCRTTVITDDVDVIGPFAFSGCKGLTEVTIPASVCKIGYGAFEGTGIKSISLPANVTEIGYRVFAHCDSLTQISVAAGNTKYDSRSNCNAVIEKASGSIVATCKATTFPADIATIGYEAFAGCSALENVVIPSGITRINHYAFADCDSLTLADIPATVTFFGDRAFENCAALEKVYARLLTPENAEYGNLLTFKGVPVDTCLLIVPDDLIDLYKATKPWSDFLYVEGINQQDMQPGDVNLDGVVDIDDVSIVIAIILGKDQAEKYDRRAYITDDDQIDVDDVNAIIKIILDK